MEQIEQYSSFTDDIYFLSEEKEMEDVPSLPPFLIFVQNWNVLSSSSARLESEKLKETQGSLCSSFESRFPSFPSR